MVKYSFEKVINRRTLSFKDQKLENKFITEKYRQIRKPLVKITSLVILYLISIFLTEVIYLLITGNHLWHNGNDKWIIWAAIWFPIAIAIIILDNLLIRTRMKKFAGVLGVIILFASMGHQRTFLFEDNTYCTG